MRRATALYAALFASLAPAIALACPQCAGRQNGGPLALAGLGGLLLLPFMAAGIVITIIRAHSGDGKRRQAE